MSREPEIHCIQDHNGHHYVWLDADDIEKTGLCIGAGETKMAALDEALESLSGAMQQVIERRKP